MARRVKKKSSPLLAPAGSLIRRLSETDVRLRRKVLRYGLWALGLMLMYSLMVGTYSIPRIVRLELERDALIEANREQVVQLIDAERTRKMLLENPRYIEMIARTQYHMIRPGETIYRYRGR
jgi:cell division protein FtsB